MIAFCVHTIEELVFFPIILLRFTGCILKVIIGVYLSFIPTKKISIPCIDNKIQKLVGVLSSRVQANTRNQIFSIFQP